MDRQPIISAKDVEITFSLRGRKLNAIRKCSLDLYEGETLAIVGESGSGKSVFTKTFVGMLDANGKITGGSIMFEGRDMTKFTEKACLRTATRSYFVLRFGLSDTSRRTATPGSSSSLHRPVFLTWTVSTAPFTSTWAIKRLGRSRKIPSTISLYFNVYSIFIFV